MQESICPYLGLSEDPKTALSFPSDGNFCHRAVPPAGVKIEHQRVYCLTALHQDCPVLNSEQTGPLPVELSVPLNQHRRPQQLWRQLLIPAAILVFILSTLFILLKTPLNTDQASQEAAINQAKTNESMILLGTLTLPTMNGSAGAGTPEVTQNPTWMACTPPANWKTYVVNATDSLVRLSLLYGVSIDELILSNCLSDQALVRPGEVIYIPGPTLSPTITLTPSATSTRTRRPVVIPTWTFTPPPGISRPPDTAVPLPTVRPPTAVPPTAVPPTEVPPTVPPTVALPPPTVAAEP